MPSKFQYAMRLTNTLIVQLPDPNKPHILFTNASKFCYLDVLSQASTKESNETLMKILTSETPLTSIESQTQDLQMSIQYHHSVAYISGSFSQSQYRWPAITKECFSVYMSIKECSFYLQMLIYLFYMTQRSIFLTN